MWKAHVYPRTSSQLLGPGLGLPGIPFQMPYSPGPPPPPTRPANSHCQAQTGPMNNKADVGMVSGWESPASFKETMSHVCESLCRTHFTQLSGKEMMWLNGLWYILPLPGTRGPQSLQPPWPPFWLSTGLLRAGHPNCSCPQTNPQCILRSQGFPHWKSHKVPLASTSLWLLGRRIQDTLTTQCSSVAPVRGLQLLHTELARLEPL